MFNENGNLPAGFHDWSEKEIVARLVRTFPHSKSRSKIYSGYQILRNFLINMAFTCEQWIDGSFSTNKADPGDLDLLTVADKDLLDSLPIEIQDELISYFKGKQTRDKIFCDSYILVSVPKNHPDYDFFRTTRKYWMGEFGFDRDDRPKGIVRTLIVSPEKGEHNND